MNQNLPELHAKTMIAIHDLINSSQDFSWNQLSLLVNKGLNEAAQLGVATAKEALAVGDPYQQITRLLKTLDVHLAQLENSQVFERDLITAKSALTTLRGYF